MFKTDHGVCHFNSMFNFLGDMEWDASEADNEILSDIIDNQNNTLMLEQSSGVVTSDEYIIAITGPNQLVLNPDLSVVPEQGVATLDDDDDDISTILELLPSPNPEMTIAVPEDMTIAPVSNPGPSTSHDLAIPHDLTIAHDLAIPLRKPPRDYPKRRIEPSNPLQIKVNESIISLLLKLHSQLSGMPDSYNQEDLPNQPSGDYSNRIGDGPFFVANLLNKISTLDTLCKDNIKETKNRLWPKQQDREEEQQRQKEDKEREQRRLRAKERQQKLMAEFASKQKQFLEKTMEDAAHDGNVNSGSMEWQDNESSCQEYDCVICNQTTASTEDKPMGLVVLVQSTSVTAHRRRDPERVVLPTSEEERQGFHRDDILASEFDRRVEELDRHFDNVSHYFFF